MFRLILRLLVRLLLAGWTGTIPTFSLGQKLTSAIMNKIANNINFLGSAADASIVTTTTTTSTTYTDLTHPGPSASLTTGTSALVTITCYGRNTHAGYYAAAAFAVSGATTQTPTDAKSLTIASAAATDSFQCSATYRVTGLTPGVNVFTMKYRCGFGGTSHFARRSICVIPLA